MVKWTEFSSPLSVEVGSDSANDECFGGSLSDAGWPDGMLIVSTVRRDDGSVTPRLMGVVQADVLVAPRRPILVSDARRSSASMPSGSAQSVPPQ